MINKWQMIMLGIFCAHGAGIVAMEKKVETSWSFHRKQLSCSAEVSNSIEVVASLKRLIERKASGDLLLKAKKNNCFDCGERYISDPCLAEVVKKKNDRRIGWLPI